MDRKRQRAVILTLVAAALWGTSFPVIKLGLTDVNPSVFLFYRFLIASSIMLVLFFSMRMDWKIFLNRNLVLLGFIFSLSFFFQYVGQTATQAGEAAVLLNTTPIIVPLMSYFAINERLGARKYSAAGLGMIGVVFMSGVLSPSNIGSTDFGVALMLFSAVATSVYIIGTKRLSSEIKPMEFYPPVFAYGTAFMFVYTIAFGNGYTAIWGDPLSVSAILYLSIACSILPFFLWYWGLQHLSATASSVVTLFEPVVAIIVSVLFINEPFGLMQLVGTAFIFTAIVVISR